MSKSGQLLILVLITFLVSQVSGSLNAQSQPGSDPSAYPLQVQTLNSELTQGTINQFTASGAWGRHQYFETQLVNNPHLCTQVDYVSLVSIFSQDHNAFISQNAAGNGCPNSKLKLIVMWRKSIFPDFDAQFSGQAPIYEFTDSSGNIHNGFLYRDISENKGGIYANYKKTQYLCLVEYSSSQCKLKFDYWSVDWKRTLSHAINSRNTQDVDFQTQLQLYQGGTQNILARFATQGVFRVTQKLESTSTPMFFVDLGKPQRIQKIQTSFQMTQDETFKIGITNADPRTPGPNWEDQQIPDSNVLVTQLNSFRENVAWFESTLPHDMVVGAQGDPTQFQYIVMAVDWRQGTESQTHEMVKMQAIQIFADEPDNWEVSSTAIQNPKWDSSVSQNSVNFFDQATNLQFKYRFREDWTMKIPFHMYNVEAYPMSRQWGDKYLQQYDIADDSPLPRVTFSTISVTYDNFLTIQYNGSDRDTMTVLGRFKFKIFQRFDNLGRWPVKEGKNAFEIHVLPLCSSLALITGNTNSVDVTLETSSTLTSVSNPVAALFSSVQDNFLCKFDIYITQIVRKRANQVDLTNQRIDNALEIQQATFVATDEKYGLITHSLEAEPKIAFKNDFISSDFLGQYTLSLSFYDDLTKSQPVKYLDKQINLKLTEDCTDIFEKLDFPDQSISVQHGTDGATVLVSKQIQSDYLAFKFTEEACGRLTFSNQAYPNYFTVDILPIREPDSITETVVFELTIKSFTPDTISAESVNVEFKAAHDDTNLNSIVEQKVFNVRVDFILPCLETQADKMNFSSFDKTQLAITYDFMNPRDFLFSLPPFTANIEHCGKINARIEGPKSVDALLKSGNLLVIPRTDTGAAEGFQINLKRTTGVQLFTSTSDTLNVEFEIKFRRGTLLMEKIDLNVAFLNILGARQAIATAGLPPLLGSADFELIEDCKVLTRPENLDNCYKYKFAQSESSLSQNTVSCADKRGLERQICEFQQNTSINPITNSDQNTTASNTQVQDKSKTDDQSQSKSDDSPQNANNQNPDSEDNQQQQSNQPEDPKNKTEGQQEEEPDENQTELEKQIQKVCGTLSDETKFEKCKKAVSLALNNQQKNEEEEIENPNTELENQDKDKQVQETVSLQEDKIVISNFQGFEGITVEPFQEEEYQSQKRWQKQGLQPIIPKKTSFSNDGNAGIKMTRKVTMVPRTDILSIKRQEKLVNSNQRLLQSIDQSESNSIEEVDWNDITQVYFDCKEGCKEFDDFEVTYFDGQSLFIKFNFFDEGEASEVAKKINENDSVNENIEMIVKIDGRFLYDSTQKAFLDIVVEFLIQVPKQLDPIESLTYTEKVETAESAMTTVATGNMFVSIFLGASLKYLWNIINLIQFIVFFTDWNLSLPPKTEILIVQLRKLALLEFVKELPLYKTVLEGAESSAQNLTQLQLNDPRVEEMVIVGFIAAILIFVLLLVLLLVKLCKKKPQLLQKIKNKVFWNTVLRSLLQSYFKVAMGVAVGIQLITWDSQVQFGLAMGQIVLALILACTPLFIFFLLKKNQSKAEQMAERIGSLYLGIRTRPIESFMYSVVFLVRRFSFALVTYLLIDHKGILILSFIVFNTFKGIYLCWARPNDGLQARSVELINESILQLVAFNTLLFLVLKIEKVEAAEIETIFLYLIGFMIGGNILLIAYMSLKKVYLMIKRKIRERQFKKQMQKRANMSEWADIQTPQKSKSSENSPQTFSLSNQQSISNSNSRSNKDDSTASCKNEDSYKRREKNDGDFNTGRDEEMIPRLLANISELRAEQVDESEQNQTYKLDQQRASNKSLKNARTVEYQPLENDVHEIDLRCTDKKSPPQMKRSVESSKQLAQQHFTTQTASIQHHPKNTTSFVTKTNKELLTPTMRDSVQEKWILDMLARQEHNNEKEQED